MSQNTPAPTLSIFAGSMSGEGSADGPAAVAGFRFPGGVAADSKGNIYVADTGKDDKLNNTIRKISADGMVTTLAGTAGVSGKADGKGAEARFFRPMGIAADSQGNVYVADTGNNLVRKISPAGVVSTLAGSGEYGNEDGIGSKASFFAPSSIAVDAQGNVYVDSSYRIRKISPAGVVTTLAGNLQDYPGKDGKGSAATFASISHIAVDRQGNVYATSFSSVRKISADGVVTTISGNGEPRVEDGGRVSETQFNSATGITVDTDGNLYVLDGQAVRKIATDGTVTTLAGAMDERGHVDAPGKAARFNSGYSALSCDAAGNIFVADSDNHSIRKITRDGVVSTIAGRSVIGKPSRPDDESRMYVDDRSRMTADRAGNVYVSARRAIYNITPDGRITKRDVERLNGSVIHIGALFADRDGGLYFVNEGVTVRGNEAGGSGYSMIPKSIRTFMKSLEPSEFNSIYKLSPDGTLARIAGKSANVSIGGVVKNSRGDVLFTSHDTVNRIEPRRFLSSRTVRFAGRPDVSDEQNRIGLPGNLGYVSSIAIDAADNIYASDIRNGAIRKISPAGVVSTLAGSGHDAGSDGIGRSAGFKRPITIAADRKGNVYVLEIDADVVRKIAPNGDVSTLVGAAGKQGFLGGALPGIISRPLALAVHQNSLYILMADGLVAVVRNLP